MHEFRSNLLRGAGAEGPIMSAKPGRNRTGKEGLAGVTIRREESRRSDQRAEERHLNVVDQATLRYRRRAYEVSVLNVSSRGIMIASDLGPRIGARMDIRFADCNYVACFVRWLRDGRIGLEFGKETVVIGANDSERRIVSGRREGEQSMVALRKERAPRHASMLRGDLHFRQGSMPVRLRNVSVTGAMVQGEQDLDRLAEVVLELPGIAIAGRVQWCRSKLIGIHFVEEFDLQHLVQPGQAEPGSRTDGFLKPDYLQSELSPDSPWAARWNCLTRGDL